MVKSQINVSGLVGHTVSHSCSALSLQLENSHPHYVNERAGRVPVRLGRNRWWADGAPRLHFANL